MQRAWFNGVREADSLAALLAQPPQAGKAPSPDQFADLLSQLGDRTRAVTENLKHLRKGFQLDNPEQVMKVDEAGPEATLRRIIRALQQVEAGLAASCPTAPEREALLHSRRLLAQKLDEDTRQLDKEDNRKERPSQVPENLLPRQAASRTGEPDFRARVVLALLRLAGVSDDERKKPEQALAEAKKKGTPAAWHELAGIMQQAWDRQRQLLPTLDLVPADRLSRILEGPAGEAAGVNPTLPLRRRQAKAYWEWLGDSFWSDAEGLGAAPAYQELLRDTSRVCKQAAPGD